MSFLFRLNPLPSLGVPSGFLWEPHVLLSSSVFLRIQGTSFFGDPYLGDATSAPSWELSQVSWCLLWPLCTHICGSTCVPWAAQVLFEASRKLFRCDCLDLSFLRPLFQLSVTTSASRWDLILVSFPTMFGTLGEPLGSMNTFEPLVTSVGYTGHFFWHPLVAFGKLWEYC